jgi:hypothetical protein
VDGVEKFWISSDTYNVGSRCARFQLQ